MMIPFAMKSKYKDYKDYSNNPLEMVDINSMLQLAGDTATMDKTKVRYTSYCSEAQWNITNLAVNLLIKKGDFHQFDKLITEFQKAPEYQTMPEKELRMHPNYGWDWLLKKKMISQDQYTNILKTKRYAVFLDWVSNKVEPWKLYQPYHELGFMAQPMTLGGMVRMILRLYYPRERVARLLVEQLINAYNSGSDKVKNAIKTLASTEPNTDLGQKELMNSMINLTSMELAFILKQDEVREEIFDKLGYEHIISVQDKAKVNSLYAEYINAILDPQLKQRSLFDKRLSELDKKLELMQVRMKVYGPRDTRVRKSEANTRFFMWVAPQSWVFWAKYPNIFSSFGVRYVATAMHYQQSQKYESENTKHNKN